ncbi:MAG: type II toxin-antitoxin system Phd/YefM family antitoxin [Pseudomonadota bacterium]
MKQVTIQDAETHLSRLVDQVLAGEEIVITKGSKPVARLVPLASAGFRIGSLADEVGQTSPDFLQPDDDDGLTVCDWSHQSGGEKA